MVMSRNILLKGEKLEGDLLAWSWLQPIYTAIGTLPAYVDPSLLNKVYSPGTNFSYLIMVYSLVVVHQSISLRLSVSISHFGWSGVEIEED